MKIPLISVQVLYLETMNTRAKVGSLLVPAKIFNVRNRMFLPDTLSNRRLEVLVRRKIRTTMRRLAKITGVCIPLEDDFLIWLHYFPSYGGGFCEDYGVRVMLNWQVLIQNKQLFLDVLIPHEVAHIYQSVMAPTESDHGPYWRGLMGALGLSAAAAFFWRDDEKRYAPTFIYKCECQRHALGKQRHLAQCRQRLFYCSDCGNDLNFLFESVKRVRMASRNA